MEVKEEDNLLGSKEAICESHDENQEDLPKQQKSFQCKICKKIFSGKQILNRHMKTHRGLKEFKCYFCKEEFDVKEDLHAHQELHLKHRKFKCDICMMEFFRETLLINHIKTHSVHSVHEEEISDSEDVKLKFKCYLCRKEFGVKSALKKHLKRHSGIKDFKCELCSKEFWEKGDLKQHKKIHSVEKEFKCDVCSKEFCHKRDFKQHYKTHTGEKDYHCTHCNKGFIQRISFLRHLQGHLKTPRKRSGHTCEVCSKEFKDEWKLKRHIGVHSKTLIGLVNVQFPLDKEHVKQPSTAYSNLKKFRCHVCGAAYSEEFYFMKHMLKHNDQMIDVKNFPSNKDANVMALESDPDVDPLLIEDKTPPVVKEEVPDLAPSEEDHFILGSECSVKAENNVDDNMCLDYISDDGDADIDCVKVEDCPI